TYLSRARVLANILSIKGYKNINQKSGIKEIALKIDLEKIEKLNGERKIIKNLNNYRKKLITPLFNLFFGKTTEHHHDSKSPKMHRLAEIY
ncbi:hypothetical protein ACC848_39715, partial [Rhizobium johnstonii]